MQSSKFALNARQTLPERHSFSKFEPKFALSTDLQNQPHAISNAARISAHPNTSQTLPQCGLSAFGFENKCTHKSAPIKISYFRGLEIQAASIGGFFVGAMFTARGHPKCYRFAESVTDLEAFNAATEYQLDSMTGAINLNGEDWLIEAFIAAWIGHSFCQSARKRGMVPKRHQRPVTKSVTLHPKKAQKKATQGGFDLV